MQGDVLNDTATDSSGTKPGLSPVENGRDLRLDLLRGLFLLKMIFDHLPDTPLHAYRRYVGFVSAAEGFFLLSGAVVAIAYGGVAERSGMRQATRGLWRRAATLYLANLALVLALVVLELRGLLPVRDFAALWGSDRPTLADLLHFDQPYFLHVLPRYVFFLALAPAALALLRRSGGGLVVLGVSVAVWWLNWNDNGRTLVPLLEPTRNDFRLLSWQLPFFAGMVLGTHRDALSRLYAKLPKGALLTALCAGAAAFALARVSLQQGLYELSGADRYRLFGREQIGPLRIVNASLVLGVLFVAVDRFWQPVHRASGWLLRPLGENSLFVFLLHIVLLFALLASGVYSWPIFHVSPWSLLLYDVLVLALLFALTRARPRLRLPRSIG